MSKMSIIVLMSHRHTPLDPIYRVYVNFLLYTLNG
jgi:hypothetical protein